MAGVTAAVHFIAGLSPASGSLRDRLVSANELIDDHELRLRHRIEDGLAAMGERVVAHSVATERTPTLFVTFRDLDAKQVSRQLAQADILAPAGSFYAYEPFRALGLGVDAGLRVGLAAYNDDADVDRLLDALQAAMSA
jgi:selenocysteine lyase/cysteine desulfurase